MHPLIAIFVSALAVSGLQASVPGANPDRLKSPDHGPAVMQQIPHDPGMLDLRHGLVNIAPVNAIPADGKSFYNEFLSGIAVEDDSNRGQAVIDNRENEPSSHR